jgi:hypothetical protein
MFGRRKRTDAHAPPTEVRSAEAIVTAATEPVLPPPPPPTAAAPPPPIAPPAPAPSVAPSPVMQAPPPPAPPTPPTPPPAPPTSAPADELSPADIRARTLLADSIARMELSLKLPPPPPSAPVAPEATAGGSSVEALADSVARTASEVARALEHVSSMCAMLGERLDADRDERRALTEAIERLGGEVSAQPEVPATVFGGTVFAVEPERAPEPEYVYAPEPEPAPAEPVVIQLDSAPVISLVDEERAPEPAPPETADSSFFASPPPARERDASMLEDDGVVPSVSMFAAPPPAREPADAAPEDHGAIFDAPLAPREEVISIVEEETVLVLPGSETPTGAGMWCRDDDHWIGGVEIADFISDNGTIRYWLRRTSDGQMLPRPFDATDLRFVRETAPAGGES